MSCFSISPVSCRSKALIARSTAAVSRSLASLSTRDQPPSCRRTVRNILAVARSWSIPPACNSRYRRSGAPRRCPADMTSTPRWRLVSLVLMRSWSRPRIPVLPIRASVSRADWTIAGSRSCSSRASSADSARRSPMRSRASMALLRMPGRSSCSSVTRMLRLSDEGTAPRASTASSAMSDDGLPTHSSSGLTASSAPILLRDCTASLRTLRSLSSSNAISSSTARWLPVSPSSRAARARTDGLLDLPMRTRCHRVAKGLPLRTRLITSREETCESETRRPSSPM